jgi:pyruvate dehydrogenase E1 component beta subunit
VTREVSYREALGEALREAMRRDERVIVLGQDVGVRGGAYGVTAGLLEEFGAGRVLDAPSAEAAMVGVGIGAAMTGLRPVVELTTAAFAALAFDQLVHHAAPLRALSGGALTAPLVLRMPQGAGGRLGPIHSANVEGLLHHIPGLAVWAPSTPADAHAMLAAAIRADDPVVLLEHTALYDARGELGEDDRAPAAGAAVRRPGTDVTIAAASRMVPLALAAAEALARDQGIDAEVLDLRVLRPLDASALAASVARTGHAVLVEEGWPAGGVTATLAASLPRGTPIVRVTAADTPVPYARALEHAALPDADAIVAAALALVVHRPTAAPGHRLTAEIDVESLVATRRATGTPLAGLVASAATPLLRDAVVVCGDDVVLLGTPAPGAPSATLTLGAVTTRPRAYDGAVTIRHLASLTLRLAPGVATAAAAEALLATLRDRLAAG